MAGPTESVVLRVGWDASAVSKGMANLKAEQARLQRIKDDDHSKLVAQYKKQEQLTKINQQKRLRDEINTNLAIKREKEKMFRNAKDLANREFAEQAKRNIKARQLWRQRAEKRAGGEGFSRGGVVTESLVLVREAMRGNWNRAAGSVTILAQKAGILGKAISFLLKPSVSGPLVAAAAFFGTASGINKTGRAARATVRNANAAGFSVEGYQGLMRSSAGEDEGGPEAAQGSINHLMGRAGAAANGSEEAYKSFRRWGISIADVNGKLLSSETIFKSVLDRINSMPIGLSRSTAAAQLLGENWQKLERTIAGGSEGFDKAKSGYTNSAGQLATLSGAGDFYHGMGAGIKRGASSLGSRLGGAYANMLGFLNPNIGKIAAETNRGAALDAKLAAMPRRGMSAGAFNSRLKTINPELFEERRGLQEARRDTVNAFDDRLKPSLSAAADSARSFTGTPHRQLYGVTARTRAALKIQDLEERAGIALLKGDDKGYAKMNSEAAQLRSANKWLPASDRDINRSMNMKLEQIDTKMATVQKMAEMAIANNPH